MQNVGVASESGNISELEKKRMTKVNFLAPFALVEKIKAIASQYNQTQSDIIRKTIEFYLAEVEKERLGDRVGKLNDFRLAKVGRGLKGALNLNF